MYTLLFPVQISRNLVFYISLAYSEVSAGNGSKNVERIRKWQRPGGGHLEAEYILGLAG